MPILNIPCTILKYKDVYTIKNEDVISITYTLSRVECESITQISTGNISVGATITLPLGLIDGKYQLDIRNTNGEKTSIFIYYYNNLLLNIINNVEEVLCGCGTCKQCDEGDNCELYLNTITTMLNYFYVNYSVYDVEVTNITTLLACNFDQKVSSYLSKKLIRGEEDSKSSFLQMIGIYYKAFYTTDLAATIDIEETNYIKAKYKSVKILKCIEDRCITLINSNKNTVDTDTNNIMVYYWQLTNTIDNINDVVEDFNLAYLIGKNNQPYDTFTEGVSITYTNIGRICFSIKKTTIQTYELYDFLGNNITYLFDSYYSTTYESMIFVSKEFQSYSTMFIRIQQTSI